MRFMLMTTDGGGDEEFSQDEKLQAEMGAFIAEMSRSGVLLATGGLEPHGTRIASSGGKVTVTDGPFAESKEGVVGFALIEVRTREEAIELSRRFYRIVGDGEGVIKQVFGPEDTGPGA
ncbi:YciI family protein [Actinomadura terrae]|uniref:YciI family protein n=1 Tax=Actinomadura terrae TaxID=604353 RepID=UPI001FA78ABF|nr:YciI family protein [Actinomadura terrae]